MSYLETVNRSLQIWNWKHHTHGWYQYGQHPNGNGAWVWLTIEEAREANE